MTVGHITPAVVAGRYRSGAAAPSSRTSLISSQPARRERLVVFRRPSARRSTLLRGRVDGGALWKVRARQRIHDWLPRPPLDRRSGRGVQRHTSAEIRLVMRVDGFVDGRLDNRERAIGRGGGNAGNKHDVRGRDVRLGDNIGRGSGGMGEQARLRRQARRGGPSCRTVFMWTTPH